MFHLWNVSRIKDQRRVNNFLNLKIYDQMHITITSSPKVKQYRCTASLSNATCIRCFINYKLNVCTIACTSVQQLLQLLAVFHNMVQSVILFVHSLLSVYKLPSQPLSLRGTCSLQRELELMQLLQLQLNLLAMNIYFYALSKKSSQWHNWHYKCYMKLCAKTTMDLFHRQCLCYQLQLIVFYFTAYLKTFLYIGTV